MNSTTKSNPGGSHLLLNVVKFYIPLAIYSMIMMTSHSVINFSLSRTLTPEIALAALAVSMNIMNMFASPTFTTRQLLVALGHDKDSFATIKKVMLKVMFFTLFVMVVVAYTPIGKFIFITIFGYPETLYPEIIAAARLCILLPFIYTLRSYSQGILMVQKKTQFLTITVVIRISAMLILAFILPSSGIVEGASVGIAIWLSGMSIEAIVNFLFSRKYYAALPQTSEVSEDKKTKNVVTQLSAFNFLWPLIITSFMWTLGKPLINSGLSRSLDPELSLATFQVAYNFTWILIALLENNLRQVPLLFGDNEDKRLFLRKFTFVVSLIISGAIAVLAFTPLGQFALTRLIGAEPHIAANSTGTLLVLIAAPLIVAWVEYFQGVLLYLGNTKALSVAKLCNMLVATLMVYAVAIIVPASGATAGAIGVMFGYFTEMIILRTVARKQVKKGQAELQTNMA